MYGSAYKQVNINSHLLEILGILISFESGDITRVSELKL